MSFSSQVSAVQTSLVTAHADLAASQSSFATATSKLDKLHAENRRLSFRGSDLASTADGWRLQLSNLQSSIFPSALESLRGDRGRYLGLLQSLAGQNHRLDSDFTTLITQARDSRSPLCRGVGPLFERCRAFVTEDGIFKDGSVSFPI